jgi:hypothetical protein
MNPIIKVSECHSLSNRYLRKLKKGDTLFKSPYIPLLRQIDQIATKFDIWPITIWPENWQLLNFYKTHVSIKILPGNNEGYFICLVEERNNKELLHIRSQWDIKTTTEAVPELMKCIINFEPAPQPEQKPLTCF